MIEARLHELEARVAELEASLAGVLERLPEPKKPRKPREKSLAIKDWEPGESALSWIRERWGSTPYASALENFKGWSGWRDRKKSQENWDLTLRQNPVFRDLMDKEKQRSSAVGSTTYTDVRIAARELYMRLLDDSLDQPTTDEADALKWLVDNKYVTNVRGSWLAVKQ